MLHQTSNYIKLHRLTYKRQSISYGILHTGLWELMTGTWGSSGPLPANTLVRHTHVLSPGNTEGPSETEERRIQHTQSLISPHPTWHTQAPAPSCPQWRFRQAPWEEAPGSPSAVLQPCRGSTVVSSGPLWFPVSRRLTRSGRGKEPSYTRSM